MASIVSETWGGGIYRGRKAPNGSVFDAVNALVDDEANLFQRGPTALKSNAGAETLDMLVDAYTAAGRRTIFGRESGHLWVLGPDDATPIQVTSTLGGGNGAVRAHSRPAASAGLLIFPAGPGDDYLVGRVYGGSRKTADVGGVADATNGSVTVTGTGTAWLTDLDAGMITQIGLGSANPIRSVDSDTQITLFRPFDGTTGTGLLSSFYVTWIILGDSIFQDYGVHSGAGVYLTSVGANQRLVIATRQRAFISAANNPLALLADQYLEIPSDSIITGADALLDSAILWTTGGVWRASNLDFDPVDAAGNVQWQQEQISKDVILWGDAGVAGWRGAFVVPALDDVFLFTLDGDAQPVSRSIRRLYRSYVAAGYRPGTAVVHRGHYLLPILDGTDLVDTLVCRLDQPFETSNGSVFYPWTRWAGQAAGVAYAQRVATDGEPLLLGLAGERVTDLTSTLDGEGGTDADSEPIEFTVITSDYATGANQPGTVQRVRLRYELESPDVPDDFNRPDGPIGDDWTTSPWGPSDAEGLEVFEHHAAGAASFSNAYRSWLNTRAYTAPLASRVTILSRPGNNANTVVSAAIGFAQNPVAGSGADGGYEARVRFEVATDTVIIDRRDGQTPTRILSAIPLGARIESGDTLGITVSDEGLISVLVNDAVIGSVTDTAYFQAGQAARLLLGILDITAPDRPDTRLDSTPPHLEVAFSSDQDAGIFTSLAHSGGQDGVTGGSLSDGSRYTWWQVGKRRERIRFRITVAGATRFVLRTLEAPFRPSGRQ